MRKYLLGFTIGVALTSVFSWTSFVEVVITALDRPFFHSHGMWLLSFGVIFFMGHGFYRLYAKARDDDSRRWREEVRDIIISTVSEYRRQGKDEASRGGRK